MSAEIKAPLLPESVIDATVVVWYKQPGEAIQAGEKLIDLETDKVVLGIPAPVSGVLAKIQAPPGTVVKTGDLLALLEIDMMPTATPSTAADAPMP